MIERTSNENSILIRSDGSETKLEAPSSGHGEHRIIWKDGKILDVVKEERIRIQEKKI
ncbi:DUF3954 domain-containing protein [Psychrobacillus glaciei]|nr:DUF3954 domain-containing protein [Psychrobacillus glaciei]